MTNIAPLIANQLVAGEWSRGARPEPDASTAWRVDPELVAQAQSSDAAAFAQIFALRARPVTHYVWSILRDEERTRAVVSQTFLEAWRQLPRLGRADQFESWLFGIAHDRSMAELGRASEGEGTHGDAGSKALVETATEVREGLAALSEDQRQVIVLRIFLGLRHKEIARQMGRSEAAVRSLQLRGLRRLGELLGE